MERQTEYAEDQPFDGERILHCGHLKGKLIHWFRIVGGCDFTRPDGSSGRSAWIMACDACMREAKGNWDRLEMRGDATWKGNAPVIKKVGRE